MLPIARTRTAARIFRPLGWPAMPPAPTVTLLLPNRNNEPILDLVLERLRENTTYPSFELVVVDDGSTDDSLAILRRWRDSGAFPSFTLMEKEHDDGGVVSALNAGLAAAAGELELQRACGARTGTAGLLGRMVDVRRPTPVVGVLTALVSFASGDIHAARV